MKIKKIDEGRLNMQLHTIAMAAGRALDKAETKSEIEWVCSELRRCVEEEIKNKQYVVKESY